ncbi:hypothetical protein ACOCEA_10035 [Maribacter sp. CXY002]|uniref:hypothetical protein n=1 Tax=Maribacter luteocoastalis TaxID=3407671 RepID=UPI003B676907
MDLEQFEKIAFTMRKDLNEEWRLKRPSPHTLDRIASRLLNIVKEVRAKDELTDDKLYWLKMHLDIFLADLDGKLLHDYRRDNKRYHGLWSKERGDLASFITRFKEILENREATKAD